MEKPEIAVEHGITFVTPGPRYESIADDLLVNFEDALDLAKTVEPPRMVLDLSHTTYFNSRFLGLLLRFSNRLGQREGRFGVCNVTKLCREVITASRLHQLFDVMETREEAIAAYSKDSGVALNA
jgi:anti-anti-sigma factor